MEVLEWAIPTITDPWYYNSILASMGRVYTGFILGIIAGTIFGLMMGWRARIKNWTFPSAELLRHIPPVAWVPLTIILMGSLSPAIILVIFIGVFFAVALNAMLGVQSIDRSIFRAATCLGAKQWHIFRDILLPGSLPSILYGMILGMGLAWLSVVAGEMISGDYGIGYLAWQSYNLIRFPEIILAMLTIGAMSYASSEIIRLFVNRLLKWKKVYV
jgi:NitT/TauT family transport system permease protein